MTVEGQRMGFPAVLWGSHLWGSQGTGAGAAQEVRVHIVQQRAATAAFGIWERMPRSQRRRTMAEAAAPSPLDHRATGLRSRARFRERFMAAVDRKRTRLNSSQ